MPFFPVASMVFTALVILWGLQWNHWNISKRTGSIEAWMYSIFIYTFSLLSWLIIAIFWAEFSMIPLAISFFLGWFSITCSQEGKSFRYHPVYFGFLSVLVPIITLPSSQEPKPSTRETKTEPEEIPMLPSNTTSASNLSESSNEGLRQRNVRSSSVNESDSLQQQPTTNLEKNTPGNS
jgi:hypothetical protein